MSEHFGKILAILRQVQGLRDVNAEDVQVTRLGGLTNIVHLVAVRGQKVVVRIPGEGTETYINREVEMYNAVAAERAGVAPAVLWADAGSGAMVTRALEGIATMTPELFKARAGSPARAGAALAKLHRSGGQFKFRFELFAMIDGYLKVLATKDVALPEGYLCVVAAATPVREALDVRPVALAPCHCDPLSENFLDDGQKMWIVDWEYSGMNDPHWDLGDLAVEAEMDAAQEAELLLGYFGRAPTAAEQGRVVIYKAMCDLLWTLWGLIQLADKSPAMDFRAYAEGRFARCKTLMNDPAFARHLAAVAA